MPPRHRRTHEPRQDGEPLSFEEDELEGEDEHLGSLGEESPEDSGHFIDTANLSIPNSISDIPGPMSMGLNTSMAPPQHLMAAPNY